MLATVSRSLQKKAGMVGTSKPIQKHRLTKLLFVDDEEGIRLTLPLLLHARGFDVRVAASVPEALSEIKTHKFDVLLSDLNIGEDGDGFTVIRAMTVRSPKAPTNLARAHSCRNTGNTEYSRMQRPRMKWCRTRILILVV
jgi:DNA-binding NtrC family response regulator